MTTYHGVGVGQHVLEEVKEALVLHKLSVDVVEFGDTHGGRLPHVRILILQTVPQRLTQVVDDLVDTDTAHRPDSQGSDERVRVLTVLWIVHRRDETLIQLKNRFSRPGVFKVKHPSKEPLLSFSARQFYYDYMFY